MISNGMLSLHARISLTSIALLMGASACAFEGQGEEGESAEVVGSTEQAAVHAGIAQAFRNKRTGRCLDGNAAGSVYTSGCYWATYQSWVPSKREFGYQLRNTQTGRCLDSNVSGDVYTQSCNGGSYQQWLFDSTSPTRLRNVATGKVLDSNSGGGVYTLPNNNGDYQRWEQHCLNGVLCLEL